ncbi:MAG: VanZ family protein, partial [Lachnospiraceae bacterium]|nr:VanZ family protein [Lachnospiraceae bacterium]
VCMSCVLLIVTGIELFQLLSAFGAFDVDDFILNCAGALLGYIFFIFCETFQKRKESK